MPGFPLGKSSRAKWREINRCSLPLSDQLREAFSNSWSCFRCDPDRSGPSRLVGIIGPHKRSTFPRGFRGEVLTLHYNNVFDTSFRKMKSRTGSVDTSTNDNNICSAQRYRYLSTYTGDKRVPAFIYNVSIFYNVHAFALVKETSLGPVLVSAFTAINPELKLPSFRPLTRRLFT